MKNKEISKKIYNQRVINKINNKIKLLGISSKLTTEKFLIIRLITTIIIFLFILINYKYGYKKSQTVGWYSISVWDFLMFYLFILIPESYR